MEFITVIKVVVFLGGCYFGFLFLVIGIRLVKADKNDYNKNKDRSGRFSEAIFGKVQTVHDGMRDYRVRAGLAVDVRKNQWIEQGTLSEEALDSVLTQKRVDN